MSRPTFWRLLLLMLVTGWRIVHSVTPPERVERIEELGFDFRRITLAIPVGADFESIGHFSFLYLRDQRLCRLGDCSVSPSGCYVVFQEGASGNLYLYRRADGRQIQLTQQFIALVKTFTWQEEAGTVEVLFETGTLKSYPIPPTEEPESR